MIAGITIARLGAGDLAQMRQLNALFGKVFEEPDTYQGNQPDDAWLQSLLRNPDFVAVAVMHEGQPVGALAAYVLPKFEQARREIYIYDLAVDDAWRRRGVAMALIAEVQRIASEIGAWVLFVQADHGDDPAIALYTKLGAREDVLHFDISPQSAD